jgi:hypothetical protein
MEWYIEGYCRIYGYGRLQIHIEDARDIQTLSNAADRGDEAAKGV